jgi:hypothetical protein
VSVIALTSAHGAPGVTTSALALVSAWGLARPGRRVLLVDADPAGSGLLAGPLRAGVPDSAGISVLAAARPPLTMEQVVGCCVALDEASTRMVLPGVADPMQARPLAATWTALIDVARDLSGQGVDILVDAGRLGHRHEPTAWLTEADLLAVVLRGGLAGVLPAAAAARTLIALRAGRSAPIGLVVDPGAYSASDVAAGLGVRDVLTIARDDWAARALLEGAGRGIRFDRSPLMRTARSVVERVGQLVPEPESVVTA